MDDCVYQAFKEAGYEYPSRKKQSTRAIKRFAKKIGVTIHENKRIPKNTVYECIIVAKSDDGSHAFYSDSLDEWVEVYGDGEKLQIVIELPK